MQEVQMKHTKEYYWWRRNKGFVLASLAWFAIQHGATAQQEALISNYTYNILSINPAFAGSRKSAVVSALYNKQFTGLESGAVQENFTFHAPISYQRFGIGASVYSIQQDIFSFSVYSGSLSYKIKLSKGFLSAGMSLGVYQQSINRYALQIQDPEDPYLQDGKSTSLHPDLGAGLFYSTPKLSIGISAQHLLRRLGNANDGISLFRHYYGIVSKAFSLTHNSSLQAASRLSYTPYAPLLADISTFYVFKQLHSTGVTYRTSGQLSFQLRLGFHPSFSTFSPLFYIAYAYDYNLGTNRVYVKGSHELMLIAELSTLKKPGKDKPVISPLLF